MSSPAESKTARHLLLQASAAPPQNGALPSPIPPMARHQSNPPPFRKMIDPDELTTT